MKRPTAEDALNDEELEALLGQITPRYPTGKRNLALLQVMADTGLRVSEAVALETRDLLREGGQLTHVHIRDGKGGKPGKIALTCPAAAKLSVWLQERDRLGLGRGAVFCTISKGKAAGHFAQDGQQLHPGKPISARYVRQLVNRLASKAAIERRISPHTLRHTFANRLLRRGENMAVVQKAMRHSSIKTTVDIYGNLNQRDADEAIRRLYDTEEQGPQSDQVQRLVETLATLSEEQREALAEALAMD